MRLLTSLARFSNPFLSSRLQTHNVLGYLSCRNLRVDSKIKWVRPARMPTHHSSQTGDLSPFKPLDEKLIREHFQNCELLKNANENVKKIFSMKNQSPQYVYRAYRKSLVDKVKQHKYDKSSWEVKLANITAEIRIKQHVVKKVPSNGLIRKNLHKLVNERKRKLKELREYDYKKFEWLLDKLDLKYVPDPIVKEKVTRKKSLKLLTDLRKEKLKEKKLAKLKQQLDELKVPYLEKKLEKMRWIKEQEATLQLNPTVTDSDINNVISQIESVKLGVINRQKKGYLRKVHPYTLELYQPNMPEVNQTQS